MYLLDEKCLLRGPMSAELPTWPDSTERLFAGIVARRQLVGPLVIVLKTAEGGAWILPHIAEARSRGLPVVVIIPAGKGRLADALAALCADDDQIRVEHSQFDFVFRARPATALGLLSLRKQIRRLTPGAIVYHLYASALAVRISCFGMSVPKVYMVAGPLYLESKLIRFFERGLMRLDTRVIGGSKYTAGLYRSLGLPQEKVHAIPYGVDVQKFSEVTDVERRVARDELGLPRDSFVVVMVAFVYPPKRLVFAGRGIKGHEDLLEAWSVFHRDRPNSDLIIVGGGWGAAGEAYRKQLVQSVGGGLTSNRIKWLDTLDDVRVAYRAADVSVSPSLSENHGAALEASAMGTPCIVSDADALPETVTAESGWVHKAASPSDLAEMLSAAHLQKETVGLDSFRLAARSHAVKYFDQRDCARLVIDLVEGLQATGQSGPKK